MTPVGEHVTHIHRWVPALVLPFRFIAAPHTGHLFALLDFVITPEILRKLVEGLR